MNILLSILKVLIKFSVIFMIFFIWLRYYMASKIMAFLLSILLATILLLVLYITSKSRKNLANLKSKERQEAEGMFESLIKNNDYQFFYSFEIDELLSICFQAKKVKADKIVILAKEVSKEAENFALTLNADILLLDQYATYEYLFKEYDFYPEFEKRQTKSKRGRFKEIFDYSFDRARTKGYIMSALVLLLITFLFRQNLYYSIVATILLVFALICLIRNPKSKKITKQIL